MSEIWSNYLAPTKTVYSMWGIMAVIVLFAIVSTRKMKDVPGVLQSTAEMAVGGLLGFYEEILGPKRTRQYFPMLATFFVFIVVCNYCSLLPGAGEYFTIPTSVLAVTAALAVIAFFTIHTTGVMAKGLGGYLKSFLTLMLPISLLELVTRPLSLALRLYGNIYGEERVTETFYGLFPILLPLVMNVLSLLFCLIQAMIFSMLVAVFVAEATETEEEK
mgnify:CR=1 FL=1